MAGLGEAVTQATIATDQSSVIAAAKDIKKHNGSGEETKSREYSTDAHILSFKELSDRFGTHLNIDNVEKSTGLTCEEASQLLAKYGPNLLSPPKTTPEWLKFLKQFGHLLLMLLEAASLLGFIAYGLNGDRVNLAIGLVLAFVVLLTAVMNYLQERAASDVLASIQGMLPAQTRVIRDGKEFVVPAADLVPGDLVRLTIGARVPADIRIVAASDFKVEMSSLTGESDAIECGSDRKSDAPTEARNLIFNSTLVMSGECRGVVVKTGDETMIGSIAGLAADSGPGGLTTMEREVRRVVYFISGLAIVTASIFFGIGMGRGLGLVFSLVNFFLLVLVANVPEGLPATVTSILQLTAKTLAHHNILIKRTDLIETLGSCSVIASDKTGTLTQNRMTVENIWSGGVFHKARSEIRRAPTLLGTLGSPASVRGRGESFSSLHSSGSALNVHASMTIGRGMSFLSLGEGQGPVAVIHSTGPAEHRERGGSCMSLGHGSGSGGSEPGSPLQQSLRMTFGRSGALGQLGGMQLLSVLDLQQPASTRGRPSAPAAVKRPIPPSLSAVFDSPEQNEGEDTPSASQPTQDGSQQAAAAEPDGEDKENPSPPLHGQESMSQAQAATPSVRPGVGFPGSDLVLTGFTGPLADVLPLPLAQNAHANVRVAVYEPVEAGLEDVSIAVQDWAGGAGAGKDGPAKGQVVAEDGAVAPAAVSAASVSSLAVSVALPTLLQSDSFTQHVSFQSFKGFTRAVWAQTNAFSRMAVIAAVCNKAEFSTERNVVDTQMAGSKDIDRTAASRPFPAGVDPRPVLGDASDAALLRYVDSLAPIFEWRAAYPILFEIPFNSAVKWSLVVTRCPEDSKSHLVFMKGAPERIVQACSHHFLQGSEVPIGQAFLKQWGAAYERFGVMGERVLGFAYAKIPARPPAVYKSDPDSVPRNGLVFAGLMSLVDPPKVGTEEAVAVCKGAGIRVTMVTGDHPLTAEAIARKVGIISLPTVREVAAGLGVPESAVSLSDSRVGAAVIAGHEIPGLTADQWAAIISKREVVFARTSPQQKLQIVQAYQAAGHVVAVTGDGTNDSPALKKADIGVAMGSANASDVARDAADMIILDDDFSSIVHAIAMGRTVFENIKKTIAYTITHLWPELIPVLALLVLDVPIMLTGLLILLVDCVTEQGPAISLTYEPAETSVMARPPRNLQTDRLVDFPLLFYAYIVMGLTQTAVCVLAFCSVFLQAGVPLGTLLYRPTAWVDGADPILLPDGSTLSAATQTSLYRTAVGAYFLNLVLCQGWHIFLTKTRRVSVLSHTGVTTWEGARATVTGVLIAVLVMILAVYVPGLNDFFGTAPAPAIAWTPHLLFAAWAFVWSESVKAGARREEALGKKGWVTTYLAW